MSRLVVPEHLTAAQREARERWDEQFRSLLRLQSKALGTIVQRDMDRRHASAKRLDAEADAMLSVGFMYGHTLRDIAQRIRHGAAQL